VASTTSGTRNPPAVGLTAVVVSIATSTERLLMHEEPPLPSESALSHATVNNSATAARVSEGFTGYLQDSCS
jgi:hypothetical protein